MSDDQLGGTVAIVLMLVLVGGNLATRGLPWPRMALMALAWGAIFVAAIVIATLLSRN